MSRRRFRRRARRRGRRRSARRCRAVRARSARRRRRRPRRLGDGRRVARVDLDDLGARVDERAVAGRPARQRGAESEHQIGGPISRFGDRRGEAAGDADRPRRARRTGRAPWRRWRARRRCASPSASSGSRAPESTAPRPAMMTGRRAAAMSSATSAMAAGDGAGGGRQRGGRGSVGGGRLRLHVERHAQQHRPPLHLRAAEGPRDIVRRARPRVHALGRPRRPSSPAPPGRAGSSSAAPRPAPRRRSAAAACAPWPPRSGPSSRW